MRPIQHPRWVGYVKGWAAVAIATFALATSGAVAAAESGPGRPLFAVRLAVEAALLPASTPDRVRAQVERLDRRVGEAVGADRDDGAVLAAVASYHETLDDLAALVKSDPADAPDVVRSLEMQISSLEALAARTAAGAPAIERALLDARSLQATLDSSKDRSDYLIGVERRDAYRSPRDDSIRQPTERTMVRRGRLDDR